MRWVVCLAFVAASIAVTPTVATAGTTGGISGHVFGYDGKPLARATIVYNDALGKVTTTSDSTGFYAFVSLWPGTGFLVFGGDLGGGSSFTSVWADEMRTVDVRSYQENCLCHARIAGRTLVWAGITNSVWSFGPDGNPQYASQGR